MGLVLLSFQSLVSSHIGSTSRRANQHQNPAISKRFIETAEKVGADDEEALERAFKKIAPKPSKDRQDRP
jgi:hypothetical protein